MNVNFETEGNSGTETVGRSFPFHHYELPVRHDSKRTDDFTAENHRKILHNDRYPGMQRYGDIEAPDGMPQPVAQIRHNEAATARGFETGYSGDTSIEHTGRGLDIPQAQRPQFPTGEPVKYVESLKDTLIGTLCVSIRMICSFLQRFFAKGVPAGALKG